MTRRIVFAEEAEEHIGAIDRWWRENRLVAPDLFVDELTSALDTLASYAGVGRRYPQAGVRGVRRTLLRGCRYHVYYVATRDEVVVLAVWNAARGTGPSLGAATPPPSP